MLRTTGTPPLARSDGVEITGLDGELAAGRPAAAFDSNTRVASGGLRVDFAVGADDLDGDALVCGDFEAALAAELADDCSNLRSEAEALSPRETDGSSVRPLGDATAELERNLGAADRCDVCGPLADARDGLGAAGLGDRRLADARWDAPDGRAEDLGGPPRVACERPLLDREEPVLEKLD
jgi:hypothetical protein